MSETALLRIRVNGEPREIHAPCSVQALVDSLRLGERRIAVELNEKILPRQRYDQALEDGDAIEIVTFVGGG